LQRPDKQSKTENTFLPVRDVVDLVACRPVISTTQLRLLGELDATAAALSMWDPVWLQGAVADGNAEQLAKGYREAADSHRG
jgi:hypothetical protein